MGREEKLSELRRLRKLDELRQLRAEAEAPKEEQAGGVLNTLAAIPKFFGGLAAPAEHESQSIYQKITGSSKKQAESDLGLAARAATSNIGGAGFMETPGTVAKGLFEGGKKLLSRGVNAVSQGADDLANKLTINATGATKAQAAAFPPDAAKKMRDLGLVGAFDTAESIAGKAKGMVEKSGTNISNALKTVEDAGAQINVDELAYSMLKQADELKLAGNPRQADALIKQAEQLSSDYAGDLAPSVVENLKREAQQGINYMADAKPLVAGKKAAASLQREAVEQAATSVDPALGAQFKADKELYSLAAPIEEAAAGRALQQQQKQITSLKDLVPIGAVTERVSSTLGAVMAKIPRTIEGIKAALPQIMRTNPGVGAEIQRAVSLNRESAIRILGPLMNQMGDQTEPSEYPSEFEGKLHSPDDVSAYKQRISRELPPRERAKAMSAVHKDGSITGALPPPAPIKTDPDDSQIPRRTQTLSDVANRLNGVKQRAY